MSFIVGLTGGIGSGKSAVADLFSARGVVVVDTDALAHALTAHDGAAMPDIVAAFGTNVRLPSGGLDRTAMRRRIFADPAERRRLEDILHPLIRREAVLRCQTAFSPYVILAVPLLLESGAYQRIVQRVLVVDCRESTQIERVMARSGLSAADVRRIVATQASRAERLAIADDVIDNEGEIAALAPQVEALHERYLGLSGQVGLRKNCP